METTTANSFGHNPRINTHARLVYDHYEQIALL